MKTFANRSILAAIAVMLGACAAKPQLGTAVPAALPVASPMPAVAQPSREIEALVMVRLERSLNAPSFPTSLTAQSGTAAYVMRPTLMVQEKAPLTVDPVLLPASTSMPTAGVVAAPMGFVAFCAAHGEACAAGNSPGVAAPPVALTAATIAQLRTVNDEVNEAIWPAAERSASGDTWSIAPTYGDCDDYAVTKRDRLLKAGWPANTLLLATARTAGGERHAVLVAVTDRGDFVLDNLRSQVVAWSSAGYLWEARQTRENPKVWQALAGGPQMVASLQ